MKLLLIVALCILTLAGCDGRHEREALIVVPVNGTNQVVAPDAAMPFMYSASDGDLGAVTFHYEGKEAGYRWSVTTKMDGRAVTVVGFAHPKSGFADDVVVAVQGEDGKLRRQVVKLSAINNSQ